MWLLKSITGSLDSAASGISESKGTTQMYMATPILHPVQYNQKRKDDLVSELQLFQAGSSKLIGIKTGLKRFQELPCILGLPNNTISELTLASSSSHTRKSALLSTFIFRVRLHMREAKNLHSSI